MKHSFIAVLLAALLPGFAFAATVNLPSRAPVATIEIPDSWDPTEIEHGVQAISSDQAVYLSIEVADEKSSDGIIEGVFSFLEENGVTVDDTDPAESNDVLNDMEIVTYDWQGSDADGPVSISVILAVPKPGRLLVLTYWGSRDKEDRHESALVDMLASLKPVRR